MASAHLLSTMDNTHGWFRDHAPLKRTVWAKRGPIHNRNFMMKVLLLSLLVMADAGGGAAAAIVHDNASLEFFQAAFGGICGVAAAMALYTGKWTIADAGALARETLGNLPIAVMAGPFCAHYIADRLSMVPTPQWVVLVSGILGIGGLSLVKALWPPFVQWAMGTVGFKKDAPASPSP